MRRLLALAALLTGSLVLGGIAPGQASPAGTSTPAGAAAVQAVPDGTSVTADKKKPRKKHKKNKHRKDKKHSKGSGAKRGRGKPKPKPTPRPSPSPTATPSPTPPAPTVTPAPSPPAPSPPAPPSPPPTATPTPTPTVTPTPSMTPTPTTPTASPSTPVTVTVPGTSCPAFPGDNYWNTPVAALPVHARSATWLTSIGSRNLHPDFGPSYGEQSVPYGIPVTVVSGTHPKVPVVFDYADESDQVAYPLGDDTLIEGGREAGGDRHTIVVDAASCTLYETWNTWPGTPWTAGSGAVWDLRSNALRPAGWTSADAAGLPILPGLLSYDDVRSGTVRHAIRFTASRTRSEYVWPARHEASSDSSTSLPPMGARFRLKSSFNVSGFSADAQVVLRGMQDYGLVLADNGSSWYFQGTADERWPEDLVSELKQIPSSAFEAVDTSGMKVSEDSGQAATP